MKKILLVSLMVLSMTVLTACGNRAAMDNGNNGTDITNGTDTNGTGTNGTGTTGTDNTMTGTDTTGSGTTATNEKMTATDTKDAGTKDTSCLLYKYEADDE